MSITFSLINGLGRGLFGFLYDKFGFVILRIVIFLELIIGGATYFTSDIPWLFFIFAVVAAFISAATIILIPASVNKVFGLDVSSEVYGIVVLFYGVSALTAPIISKAINISKYVDDSAYLILFEVGTGLGFIGLLVTFTMNEEPFDYSQYNIKNDDEKSKPSETQNKKEVEVDKINSASSEEKDKEID
jgi:MFS family permease